MISIHVHNIDLFTCSKTAHLERHFHSFIHVSGISSKQIYLNMFEIRVRKKDKVNHV
jgi:hypothetical protein